MKNFFSHLVEKEYYSRQNTAGDFLSQRSGMDLNECSCYLHDVFFFPQSSEKIVLRSKHYITGEYRVTK